MQLCHCVYFQICSVYVCDCMYMCKYLEAEFVSLLKSGRGHKGEGSSTITKLRISPLLVPPTPSHPSSPEHISKTKRGTWGSHNPITFMFFSDQKVDTNVHWF
ncbi:hypothetical protein ATANTOWER_010596 [Ataeniobius toweri]|uniref:Uncharacterized protein n=1 Tax=Ataeniobius toweri TaxID=208326 RepID=A0ABU7AEU4_9TELE|nr:hypothetical protein [Ataeniobius toweri]